MAKHVVPPTQNFMSDTMIMCHHATRFYGIAAPETQQFCRIQHFYRQTDFHNIHYRLAINASIW